jgi:purine-binding chemotaxis protein CheW
MKKKLSFKKMLDIADTKSLPPKRKHAVAKKGETIVAHPLSAKAPAKPVRREKSESEKKPQKNKVVLFRLSKEFYGIDVSRIEEIIDARIKERIAGMPHFVLGVISLRGESIPVISLNEPFHLPESPMQESNTVLITSMNGQVFGIRIDELRGVIDIDTSSILSVPSVFPDEEMRYLKGIIRHGIEIAALIDIEQVLRNYRLG